MSKSQFEKLFEEVISDESEADAEALTGGDHYGSETEDFGDESSEDSVTLTLDRETASKLIDLLQSALGESEEEEGEEEEGEEEELGGGEMGEEEEKSPAFPESVVSEAPQSGYEEMECDSKTSAMTKKGNNKVSGEASSVASASGEGGSTQSTDKYVKFAGKVNKNLTVDSNLKPSGKSAFNR